VGKSSLLNRLAREERMTVSEVPGTTRDAVDILLVRGDRRYRVIDTAGLRQRGKDAGLPERLSAMTAQRTIEGAEVVLLVLDASGPITALDQTIAGYAAEAGRPLILVGNKWDLVEDAEEATKHLRDEIGRRFRFARQAPVLTISAKTGLRAEKVFEIIDRVEAAARRRVGTPELNRFLKGEVVSGRGPNLLYITQTGIRPPTFIVFTHDAGSVHFSLRRRLENRLRETFDFGPTPIVLRFRSRRRRPARA
jgi:GTP-binding protein